MSLVTLKQGSWIQFHIATKATWTQYSHVGPELLKMVKRAWEGSTDEYLRPVCSWESLCNYCSSASNYTDCKQFLLEDISTLHFYCLRTETLPPFLQLYKETWAINCFTTQFKVGEDFRYKLKDHPWMQWKHNHDHIFTIRFGDLILSPSLALQKCFNFETKCKSIASVSFSPIKSTLPFEGPLCPDFISSDLHHLCAISISTEVTIFHQLIRTHTLMQTSRSPVI